MPGITAVTPGKARIDSAEGGEGIVELETQLSATSNSLQRVQAVYDAVSGLLANADLDPYRCLHWRVHLRILEKVADDLPKARLIADDNHRTALIDSD